jgi:arginine-tRNA-protein transferase
VSLLDLGRTSANSAYHYFDPAQSELSIGVYSVLKEMEWCRERGYQWYYLGLWVRDCGALRYKTNYAPHERLVRGRWQRFEEPEARVERVRPDPRPR